MLCFSKYNMFYAIVACIGFGYSIGSSVFVSQADSICSVYMTNHTVGMCYVAIGAGATGLCGVVWPFAPQVMRQYISLIGTMPGGHIFAAQAALVAYTEAMKVIRHIQNVAIVPLDVAECLKEETTYSLQLVRRSLFSESHVEDMNRGIKEVAASFDQARKAQDRFREAIERGFRWLESKGLSCRQTLQQPFTNCKNELERQQWLCSAGYGNLTAEYGTTTYINLPCIRWSIERPFVDMTCSALRTLGTAACGIFSEERITEFLISIRDRIAAWISNAIRMRSGVLLELHQTNYVADELANAWAPLRDAMSTGASLLTKLYDFGKIARKYVGFAALLLYPIYYILNYNYGSLDFDNNYIPEEEEENEMKRFDESAPDELRYLPLQMGKESEKLKMAPAWVPTPEDIAKCFRSLFFTMDFLFLAALLLGDFGFTRIVNQIYSITIHLFNRYQGNIFDIVNNEEAKGLQYIGQIILEQLDRLQQAAGLGRMVACARQAPPIDYDYDIFFYLLFYRLYYLFAQNKLGWVPSMICARFNPRRHKQRMRYLRARTLLRREGYEPPSRLPWLRSLFSNFGSFCSINCVPNWVKYLVDLKETLNVG